VDLLPFNALDCLAGIEPLDVNFMACREMQVATVCSGRPGVAAPTWHSACHSSAPLDMHA
jgi:hypothetical protein